MDVDKIYYLVFDVSLFYDRYLLVIWRKQHTTYSFVGYIGDAE